MRALFFFTKFTISIFESGNQVAIYSVGDSLARIAFLIAVAADSFGLNYIHLGTAILILFDAIPTPLDFNFGKLQADVKDVILLTRVLFIHKDVFAYLIFVVLILFTSLGFF